VCGRVIMLQKGRIIADCATHEMVGRLAAGGRVRVRVRGEAEAAEAALCSAPGVGSVRRLAQHEPDAWDFALESADGSDIRAPVFRALAAADLPLLAAHGADASLEDAFLSLTADAAGEEGAP